MATDLFALSDAAVQSAGVTTQAPEYTQQDPKALLNDPRFHQDLIDYYKERDGKSFADANEAIKYWMSDREWRNINTMSMGKDIYNSVMDNTPQKQRMSRIQASYEAQPNFYERDGGWKDFFTNILPAVLLDPTNLLGAGAGHAAAALAIREASAAAIKAGGKALTEQEAWRIGRAAAIKDAALKEGAANAAVSGVQEAAGQARDVNLGRRDGFNVLEIAGEAAAGGALGAGVGGALGYGSARLARDGSVGGAPGQAVSDALGLDRPIGGTEAAPVGTKAAVEAGTRDGMDAVQTQALSENASIDARAAAGTGQPSVAEPENPQVASTRTALDALGRVRERLMNRVDALHNEDGRVMTPEAQADYDETIAHIAKIDTVTQYPEQKARFDYALANGEFDNAQGTWNGRSVSQHQQDLIRQEALWNRIVKSPTDDGVAEAVDAVNVPKSPAPSAAPGSTEATPAPAAQAGAQTAPTDSAGQAAPAQAATPPYTSEQEASLKTVTDIEDKTGVKFSDIVAYRSADQDDKSAVAELGTKVEPAIEKLAAEGVDGTQLDKLTKDWLAGQEVYAKWQGQQGADNATDKGGSAPAPKSAEAAPAPEAATAAASEPEAAAPDAVSADAAGSEIEPVAGPKFNKEGGIAFLKDMLDLTDDEAKRRVEVAYAEWRRAHKDQPFTSEARQEALIVSANASLEREAAYMDLTSISDRFETSTDLFNREAVEAMVREDPSMSSNHQTIMAAYDKFVEAEAEDFVLARPVGVNREAALNEARAVFGDSAVRAITSDGKPLHIEEVKWDGLTPEEVAAIRKDAAARVKNLRELIPNAEEATIRRRAQAITARLIAELHDSKMTGVEVSSGHVRASAGKLTDPSQLYVSGDLVQAKDANGFMLLDQDALNNGVIRGYMEEEIINGAIVERGGVGDTQRLVRDHKGEIARQGAIRASGGMRNLFSARKALSERAAANARVTSRDRDLAARHRASYKDIQEKGAQKITTMGEREKAHAAYAKDYALTIKQMLDNFQKLGAPGLLPAEAKAADERKLDLQKRFGRLTAKEDAVAQKLAIELMKDGDLDRAAVGKAMEVAKTTGDLAPLKKAAKAISEKGEPIIATDHTAYNAMLPDGMVPAIRRTKGGKAGEVHALSTKQYERGLRTYETLWGGKSEENWERGFVPQGTISGGSEATKLFRVLGETPGKEQPRAVLRKIATETAAEQGRPFSIKEAQTTPLGESVTASLRADLEVLYNRVLTDGEVPRTVHELMSRAEAIETMPWPKSVNGSNGLKMRVKELAAYYRALSDAAPKGIALPNSTRRWQAKNLRERVLVKSDPAEVAQAIDILRRLGSRSEADQNVAPYIFSGEGESSFMPPSSADNPNRITLSPSDGTTVNSGVTRLLHEVAHWGYMNILTPDLRMDFWNGLEKFYGSQGLDLAALERALPGLASNGTHSPQELFANQFVTWAVQNKKVPGLESFWARITRMTKELFAHVMGTKVEEEWVPLFERILPNEAPNGSSVRRPSKDADPHSVNFTAQNYFIQILSKLDDARSSLDQALRSNLATGNLFNMQRDIVDAQRKVWGLIQGSGVPGPIKNHADVREALFRAQNEVSDRVAKVEEDSFATDAKAWDDAALTEDNFDQVKAASLSDKDLSDKFFEMSQMGNDLLSALDDAQVVMAQALHRSGGENLVIRPQGRRASPAERAAAREARRETAATSSQVDAATRAAKDTHLANGKAAREADNTIRAARSEHAARPADISPSADAITEHKTLDSIALRKAFAASAPDSAERKTLADEIVRRLSTRRMEGDRAKADTIPDAYWTFPTNRLKAMAADALDAADDVELGKIIRVLEDGHGLNLVEPILPLSEGKVARLVQQEAADSVGSSKMAGWPAGTRADAAEVASRMTHRDPKADAVLKTLTYRLYNMMGRTLRDNVDNANLMTVEDLYRLTGKEAPAHVRGAMIDLSNPPAEFAELRSTMRRFAIGLTEGKSSPIDLMHEAGHIALRTSLFNSDDVQKILSGFQAATDRTAIKLRADHPNESQMWLAEEWFAEKAAQFHTGRVAKGDIEGLRVSGAGLADIQLRSGLSQLFDRLVQALAYMFNGLIRNNSTKQMFRRMSYYGDMFHGSRREGSGLADAANGVIPELVSLHNSRVLNSFSPSERERIFKFLGMKMPRAVAAQDALLKSVTWYHGTPWGKAMSREGNPTGELRMSSRGNYGPGFYLSNDFHLGEEYSQTGRVEAVNSAIETAHADKKITKAVRDQALQVALDLGGEDDGLYHQISQYVMEINRNWSADARRQAEALSAGPARDTDFIPAIDADKTGAGERLASKMRAVRELNRIADEKWTYLTEVAGIEREPKVYSFFVRQKNTIGFDQDTTWFKETPEFGDILDVLEERGIINGDDAAYIEHHFDDGDSLDGEQVYDLLIGTMSRSGDGDEQRAILNEVVADLGFDAMRVTEPGVGNNPTPSLVILRTDIIKAIGADYYDLDKPGIWNSEITKPTPVVGEMLSAIIDGDIEPQHLIEGGRFQQLATGLDRAGFPSSVSGVMRKMMRKEELVPADGTVMRTAGHLANIIRSNSDRLRAQANAHWYADWMAPHNGAGYFDKLASETAKWVEPLFQMINKMEGNSPWARWMDRNKFWGPVATSDANKRIVAAMRRGNISALSGEEYAVAARLRGDFSKVLDTMQDDGIIIGKRADYFPQVHDTEAMKRNVNDWVERWATYFQETAEGPMTRADAEAVAMRVFNTLDGDNGVYIPRGSARKGYHSDHEYRRMLTVTPEQMDRLGLDKYMVNDLQGIVVKYYDAMTRKRILHQQFGASDHALDAYKKIGAEGKQGIVDLLMNGKIEKMPAKALFGGSVEQVNVEHDIMFPVTRDPTQAQMLADRLISIVNADPQRGVQEARDLLIRVSQSATPEFTKRAEAIANAIKDFGGEKPGITADNLSFLETLHNSVENKPIQQSYSTAAKSFSKNIRAFNAVSLLGFTTLTSIPDTVLPLIRSGSLKSWATAWSQWMSKDPAYRDAIRNIGVSVENTLHDHLSHMYGSQGGRASSAFLNAVGLVNWTGMQREVAGLVAIEAFRTEAQAAQKMASNGKTGTVRYRTAQRFLKHYGLEKYGEPGSPAIDDIRNADIDDSVRWAINKFSNETIFAPSINDVPMWAQTPWGQIAFQLKSFPLQMGKFNKHILSEAAQGNMRPLMQMATVGVALGMGAMAAKDYTQARSEDTQSGGTTNSDLKSMFNTRERRLSKIAKDLGMDVHMNDSLDKALGWYVEGFLQLGGLGLVADMMYNTAAKADNGAWGTIRVASSILGPSFGLLADGVTTVGGIMDSEDSNSKERTAARAVAGRVPVAGGNRAFREGATNVIAGEVEAKSSGSFKSGGFGNSGFGKSGFKSGFD